MLTEFRKNIFRRCNEGNNDKFKILPNISMLIKI